MTRTNPVSVIFSFAYTHRYLDFINVMAYDFHGKWERETGHNAPLYAPSSDSEWRKQLSVDNAASIWTKMGAPKDKLVIGMPTYGRTFTMSNVTNYRVNSPASGGGKAGEYTKEAGFLAYYEVNQTHNGDTSRYRIDNIVVYDFRFAKYLETARLTCGTTR